MQIQVRVESMTERLSQGLSPEVLLQLSVPDGSPATAYQAVQPLPDGEWWIPQNSLDEGLGWSVSRKANVVRVPMFPYRMAEKTLSVLPQFGAQLASAFLLSAEEQLSGESIQKVFLIFSEVFSRDDGRPGYLVYAGAAFLV